MPPRSKRKSTNTTSPNSSPGNSEASNATMIPESPPTKQPKGGIQWSYHGKLLGGKDKGVQPLLFRRDPNSANSPVIYGFDIDDTIITPKSGAKFAKSASDWKFLLPSVPETLKKLHEQKIGVKLVFFTNQAGIEKGNTSPQTLMNKFDDVIRELHLPINVYISTGNSHFRKPSCEMWSFMAANHNGGLQPDLSKCVFVGDAAGRAKEWKPGAKKDFSCSDRQFAANIGCQFHTPESFFLKEEGGETKFDWGSFDPRSAKELFKTHYEKQYHKLTAELVVLCGPPASGKSTFFRRFFLPHPHYTHVNRDTLLTEAKCLKAAEEAFKEGKSVVVDNTNPSVDSRAQWVAIAKKHGVPARCFIMDTPVSVARHLNFVRQIDTEGEVRRVPDVAYNIYKSKFTEPELKEGFEEIVKVPFYPMFDEFANEKLFSQWTEG